VVPCPIQTRPVRHNTAPRTRRTTITKEPYARLRPPVFGR
jgi:hypothetical protein